MKSFFLPPDYKENSNPIYTVSDKIHQPHIYKLARFLSERTKDIRYIIDIGCGSGLKLKNFNKEIKVIGIDIDKNLKLFKKNLPSAFAIECDLEYNFPNISDKILSKSIVICADVIEHLYNPRVLFKALTHISYKSPFLLISTPDRILNRGGNIYPPPNKAHIREWSKEELEKLFKYLKFNQFLSGYTVNNNIDLEKKTILIISGYLAFPRRSPRKDFKILAFVPVYNEEDIIKSTLTYLLMHNIDVFVIDNWSTDSTVKKVRELQKRYKNIFLKIFPKKQPKYYLWKNILKYIEKIAFEKKEYDWFIKNDADEVFLSPWQGIAYLQQFRL